jgi:hypothetical protein
MLIDLPSDNEKINYPDVPGKLKIIVKREPYDEFYSIDLPNGNSEYVLVDVAERILRKYGVKDVDKVLVHVWNFYLAVLYVDDPTKSKNGHTINK